jgi:hypothetical protein
LEFPRAVVFDPELRASDFKFGGGFAESIERLNFTGAAASQQPNWPASYAIRSGDTRRLFRVARVAARADQACGRNPRHGRSDKPRSSDLWHHGIAGQPAPPRALSCLAYFHRRSDAGDIISFGLILMHRPHRSGARQDSSCPSPTPLWSTTVQAAGSFRAKSVGFFLAITGIEQCEFRWRAATAAQLRCPSWLKSKHFRDTLSFRKDS